MLGWETFIIKSTSDRPTWYGASSASLFITAAKDSGNARRPTLLSSISGGDGGDDGG